VADDLFAGELANQFAEIVGEAQTESGLVRVRVDSKGRIAEVRLDPTLAGVSLHRLAETITTLCGMAFDDRIDQLAAVVDDYERRHQLPPDALNFIHASLASLRAAPTPIIEGPPTGVDDEDDPGIRTLRV
jgi:DNA-binding protein YbaB